MKTSRPRAAWIYRLRGAVENDPAVRKWLAGQSVELGAIARRWYHVIRESGADVHELLHDGMPTFCVNGVAFAYVNAFKAHVNVGFYHGLALPDPARLLEGAGKNMRHVKLRPDRVVNARALEALIAAAVKDIRIRSKPGNAAA